MAPPRKPTCKYYFGGAGICHKGDRCDFSHADCFPRRDEGESRLQLVNDMVLSSLGGDKESWRDFKEVLFGYMKGKISASDLYKKVEEFNLLHLLEDIVFSLKFRYHQQYKDLIGVIKEAEVSNHKASVEEKVVTKRSSVRDREKAVTERTTVKYREKAVTERVSVRDGEKAVTERVGVRDGEKAVTEIASVGDRKKAVTERASVGDREKAVTERASVGDYHLIPVGKSVQAPETALTLEKKRLKLLEDFEAMNRLLISGSAEGFSNFEEQVSRLTKQIRGTKESVSTIAKAIVKIFEDPRCPVSISITAFSKQIVSSKQNPFACSHVIVHVTSQVPQAMDILLAEFHKSSVYTVPKHFINSELDWDSDDFKHLDSVMRIYGALVQTDGGNSTNHHGIAHGWAWLSRFLEISTNRATATALNAFLQTAGFGLHRSSKSQFLKIVDFIRNTFLEKVKSKKTSSEDVQDIIAAYLDNKMYLKEPKGRTLERNAVSADW